MTSHSRRDRWTLLALSIALAGFVFLTQERGFFRSFDMALSDRLLESRPASDAIVIVAIDDASIQAFGVWPWPRSLHALMIETLTDAGAEAIGYDVTFSETSTETEDQALEDALLKSGVVILASEEGLVPLPRFADAAMDVGSAEVLTDPDGVVRRVFVPGSLALALSGQREADGELRIPYVGPPGSFQTFLFADVLAEKIPASEFEDRIVLVGATAEDLHDAVLTPTGRGKLMSGVEVHANILQSVQEGLALRMLTNLETVTLYALIALFFGLLASRMRLRYLAISTVGLFILYLLSALAAASQLILLPILYPLSLIVLLGVADVAYRYWREKMRRAWIQDAFGRYLSPKVIDKLTAGETPLKLGGTKEELTILFSDIRGFTAISEHLAPEQLVSLLNEYLTAMTDVVLASDGVLDKYIGDAIMAFWGAPLPQADHAVRAATTAVRMKERLLELQKKWKAEGRPQVNIGVGMNTGSVIVGNMGSERRFDYTVIGDDVNLASRLEGLTKFYGVTILISEETKRHLEGKFVTRPIDRVAVKGRKEPVNVFELLPASDKGPSELANRYEDALNAYFAHRFDEAAAVFASLAKDFQDKPSAVLLERCKMLASSPPPPNWDGTYIAKEK
jgi:adenylate cyclase